MPDEANVKPVHKNSELKGILGVDGAVLLGALQQFVDPNIAVLVIAGLHLGYAVLRTIIKIKELKVQ